MREIILDVDTGTDDAMAIILAALASDIDIRAITCVHGNLPLSNTVENTLRVVQMLGLDVPVYAGCPEPMVQRLIPGRAYNVRRRAAHQTGATDAAGKKVGAHEDYLPLPKAEIAAAETHAVSFLVETLRKEKHTVVAVGPQTNIAMALRMDPTIAENIEELVVMGGAVAVGNATQSAEANFFWDPEAASIMLKADTKITVLPLDATQSALFSAEDAADFAAVATEPAVFFGKLIADFVERLRLRGVSHVSSGSTFSCAIHDALCVLYLIDPAIITDIRRETAMVDVSGGVCDGAMVVDHRFGMPLEGNVHIAYKVDKERVKNLILSILMGER